jgi:hypothetical protein
MPTNRFINVNGGEWNTAANWLLDDDGTTARVPLSGDDVVITATLNASKTITITTTNGVAKSVDFSTAGAAFTFSGTAALRVYGSLTCKSGMTWNQTGICNAGFFASGILTSNGVDFKTGSVMFLGYGGTVTLADAFTSSRMFGVAAGGGLTTNNNAITCANFGDDGNTGAITLNLGTSIINCSNVSFAAATVTTTADMAPTINLTSTVDVTANFGGVDWHETSVVAVITGGKVLTIGDTSGNTSLDKMKVSWTTNNILSALVLKGDIILTNATSDAIELVGSTVVARPMVRSDVQGTARHIHANTTDITAALDFRDIHFAPHTVDLSAITSGNCGGNEGITFRAADDYYLDYGTANAVITDNCWATASGGGAGGTAAFPLTQDTVWIDDASWDDTGNTFTITTNHRVGNIDMSALTEAQSIVFGAAVGCYGDLILAAAGTNITVTTTGATLTVDSRLKREASDTLDINIKPSAGSGAFTIDDYGGTTYGVRLLTNNLTHTGTLTNTRGTLDTNGLKWTCNILSSSNSNTRVLQDTGGGGGIVETAVTGTVIDMSTDTGLTFGVAGASLPTFTLGNSALTLTGNVTANFGASVAKTMAGLNLKKHAGDFPYIILGVGNNFGAVVPETPDATYQFNKIQWGNSASQKNVTSFNATGHASYPIYIQSDSAGAPAHLTDTDAGTNTFTYCNIKDMHVTGGTWDASGAGNTDVSGNDGWLFGLCKILVGSAWKAATAKIMVGGAWKTVTSVKKMVSGAWKA